MWVGMISLTFILRLLQGRCYGNRFLVPVGRNWHAPPLFCALEFHNGWEVRNVYARVNTTNDPCASVKIW